MSITKISSAISALHNLIDMQSGDPVSLERLKEYSGVSMSYLEQIFAVLRKAGLVESTRGPGGGYTAREDISVGDVVRAFVSGGFLLTAPVLAALDSVRITDLPEGFLL